MLLALAYPAAAAKSIEHEFVHTLVEGGQSEPLFQIAELLIVRCTSS
jgi:hypothetical protein